MNKIQKKRLYESIMKSVSKTVKESLNQHNVILTISNSENSTEIKKVLYTGSLQNCKNYIFVDFNDPDEIERNTGEEDDIRSAAERYVLNYITKKYNINPWEMDLDTEEDESPEEDYRLMYAKLDIGIELRFAFEIE